MYMPAFRIFYHRLQGSLLIETVGLFETSVHIYGATCRRIVISFVLT